MRTQKTGEDQVNEYYGLSTDTKPVEATPNASLYYEMDTQQIYMFDAENKLWIKQ